MRPQSFSRLFASSTTAFIVLAFFAMRASANYFIISDPSLSVQWSNGAANLVTWQKAVDDINGFDVEIARMSTDGLTLVARNVPASAGKLNLFLQDVPAGDDYFLIFINSTHGVMHATSSRFTILASSASPTGTRPSPVAGVPTVTVSGSPNPTMQFSTTFPALASGAQLVLPPVHASQLVLTVLGVAIGAAWTLVLGS
ncbi:hypothetical protein GALMADRAFT_232841 [Galerina marginata CBS 339.88]|uniref:Ser-Thr-rich glycosyl-phosphatidyl-inositol-anchored membrane family-domain-containing protein n=1 Tax=Galerina marginata (strain CBS 339.88) TaxID=685588 RepID=A0A067SGI4_GALM3|nr:hypothetical protein GALMADRAFT_232841 [Galerina marginata CBS 339.88]